MSEVAAPGAILPPRGDAAARARLPIACLLLAALAACSPGQYVARRAADALAVPGATWAADDDPELIAAATPFALKTIESLLDRAPDHAGLRLAAARGFSQYAYAFVQLPADAVEETDVGAAYAQRERARRLYLRARDHALAGLGLGDADAVARMTRATASPLARVGADRLPWLYWAAASWAAAIALGKDQPALIATLPVVTALLARAEALDPDFDGGGLHVLLIAFETGRPDAPRDAMARARGHFERAVALTAGRSAAPFVALAEAVAATHGDRAEFRSLLSGALAVEVATPSPLRLANLVGQRRARWLLAQTDSLFPE